MYNWRTFNEEQKEYVLKHRMVQQLPWHSPLHIDSGDRKYMITASCYNHEHRIGFNRKRVMAFEKELLNCLNDYSSEIFAWVILPNHYHCLVKSVKIKEILSALGKLHGRTSYFWNKDEQAQGRKNWCNAIETVIKSEGHFYASLNYIHHNPVKHKYVDKWQDWVYSSANLYLDKVGKDKAKKIWDRYPVLDYGKDWDI